MADEAKAEKTDKKKRLSAKDWLSRISRAKKYRDQVKDKQGWPRFFEQYEGEYKINNQSVKAPPINLVYGYVQTAISKLYFRDPYISINQRGEGTAQGARILELAINFIFGQLGMKEENVKVLMDALVVGHGWLKFGYNGTINESDSESGEMDTIKDEDIFSAFLPWDDVVFDVTLCKNPPHDCRWIASRIIKPVDRKSVV